MDKSNVINIAKKFAEAVRSNMILNILFYSVLMQKEITKMKVILILHSI